MKNKIKYNEAFKLNLDHKIDVESLKIAHKRADMTVDDKNIRLKRDLRAFKRQMES